MELKIDFTGIEKEFSEKEMIKKIERSMETMAQEWEMEAKTIVSNNKVDTGQFLNSIHYEMLKGEEIGFIGYDGVEHGVYIEFGTIKHFVPFYDKNGEPVLANWAKRVLNMSKEEMEKQGGMMVELDELMPFRKALIHIENKAQDIFNNEFNK